jgi:hypothetical protein
MNPNRVHTRLAVAGALVGLAGSALVVATTPAASASPVTSTYACLVPPSNPTYTVPITLDVSMPSTAAAGVPAPAGWLTYTATMAVPAAMQGVMDTIAGVSFSAEKIPFAIGKSVARTSGTWSTRTPGALPSDPTTYSGGGTSQAFELPTAGVYPVTMPSEFLLVPLNAGGMPTAYYFDCRSAQPTQIGTVTVTKQSSVTKIKAPKQVRHGKPLKLKGTVTDQYSALGGPSPAGRLVVKEHGKSIATGKLGAKGTAKLTVTGLSAGTHSLVVVYMGDPYHDGSKTKALKVTVTS